MPHLALLLSRRSDWTEDVMLEHPDKPHSFVSHWENVCEWVSQIVVCACTCSPPLIYISTLSCKMARTGMCLLVWRRIRDWRVAQNQLVVTPKVCWYFHFNAHHSKFAVKSLELLTTVLHCTEFSPKRASLHRILLFWHPVNWCRVHTGNEQQGTTCLLLFNINCDIFSPKPVEGPRTLLNI